MIADQDSKLEVGDLVVMSKDKQCVAASITYIYAENYIAFVQKKDKDILTILVYKKKDEL